MTDGRWSDEELERIRRSVAMLAPGHQGALNRESALGIIAELQEARRHQCRLTEVLGEVRTLVALVPSGGEAAKRRAPR